MKTSRIVLIAAPLLAVLIFAAFALTGYADTHNEMPPHVDKVATPDTENNSFTTGEIHAEENESVSGYEYYYYEEQELGDSIPKAIFTLVNTQLVNPLRTRLYTNPEIHEEMISRCPSGVFATYKSYKHADGYYYGKIDKFTGCSGDEICLFRVNEHGVTVFNRDSAFSAADEFVQNLKVKKEKLVIEEMP